MRSFVRPVRILHIVVLLMLLGAAQLPPHSMAQSGVPTLTIRADQAGPNISPLLYGAFFEEINRAGEGGIYAELVRNRGFNESTTNPLVAWSLLQTGGATGSIGSDTAQPLSSALPRALRLQVTSSGSAGLVGAANGGYYGIKVANGVSYELSLYARASGFSGALVARIESSSGAVLAQTTISGLTGSWQQFRRTLVASNPAGTSTANRLVVYANAPGTVWLQLVSLFPPTWKGRPNGLRPDLMELLAGLKPGVFRFPGGNYIEGTSRATRYRWKETIGDLTQRPGHQNSAWGYFSSDGLGYHEFLQAAEDLGAVPIYGAYAGLHLDGGADILSEAELAPIVQETLDAIEYANGDASTTWGARRAANGHPAPFNLRHIEIGNEDWLNNGIPSYTAYRFRVFYDAIKARYPDIQIISTMRDVVNRRPDLIDDHYYPPAARFLTDFAAEGTGYDNYPRGRYAPDIFIGEYGVQGGGGSGNPNTLEGALGEAGLYIGAERNADVVTMLAYAPLLKHANDVQWTPDMIHFNAGQVVATPNYYAQQLFASYLGDLVLPSTLAAAPTDLYRVVNLKRATGEIFIKVVNNASVARSVTINVQGASSVSANGSVVELTSAARSDQNTFAQPNLVVPVRRALSGLSSSFSYSFKPNSITVLTLTVPTSSTPVQRGLRSLSALTPGHTGEALRQEAFQARLAAVGLASDATTRRDASFQIVLGLASSSCVSFQSRAYPDRYLRHANYAVRLDVITSSTLDRADATFCPRPGLMQQGVSFESYNFPGRYLRHYNQAIYIASNGGSNAWDTTTLFAQDASWLVGEPWYEQELELPLNSYQSLQVTTAGLTDRWLRHYDLLARTDPTSASSSTTAKQDATFRIVAGLANPSCYSFESRNIPGSYLRHYDYRLRLAPLEANNQTYRQDATFCAKPGLSGTGVSLASYNFPNHYLRHYANEVWVARRGGPATYEAIANYEQDATWQVTAPWGP